MRFKSRADEFRAARQWLTRLFGMVILAWVGDAAAAGNVTATQFAVTESGAATISIPIQVPRGIGGMEPQLTLNYSSGAGNGVLGLGWSLQGPSAITRCPQTIANDGARGSVTFTPSDRFCLDGQRLLMVDSANPNSGLSPNPFYYGGNGSQYRTERDSFSRITSMGAYLGWTSVPAGFKVETKSGLILEFGNIQDANLHSSQVLTNVSTWTINIYPTINRWMLRRIGDRLGNFVEFEYCKGEVTPNASAPVAVAPSSCTGTFVGSAPLHYIRYTNRLDSGVVNGGFGVVFRYDTRKDMVQSFHAGSSTRQTQRMSAIQTFINFGGPAAPGTLVRSYDIYYEPLQNGTASIRATNASRISQIQERGDDGTTTLPPLTFSMAQDSVFGMNVLHVPATTTSLPPAERCGGVVLSRKLAMCP